ncbi:MAG: MXAN_5808 family serine peptidase [Polyangia bacterium]
MTKPLVVAISLFAALFLTWSRRGPDGKDRLSLGQETSAAQKDDKPYDLTALRIFNNTVLRINEAYVDPTRIDPKGMLLAALDQVQKSVAEVLVEPSADKSKVTVRVETATRDFQTSDVDSPWTLAARMREIFRFIAQNLPPGMDRETVRNIEYAAVNGMLGTLDPHSTLLDPTMNAEMKIQTRGSFGGLGIVIAIRKGALTVIKPMPGTPAGNAGVKRGDRIVRIGRESTVNMALEDAVGRLRGEPGTPVELYLERPSDPPGTPAKKFSLVRAEIKTRTVDAHMLKNGVGYIKLHGSFANTSDGELRVGLQELKNKGMKSLVFDLRANPGGLLDQAIKVVDEFVDTGTIVSTVGFANKQREDKRATSGGEVPHIPVAVLVNHGSASASEIVAGALKNLDRGVIIGTKTFGKGSVQVVYENEADGSALKLTIAQYLTPGDVSIQSVGITPDVELDRVAVDKDKGVWLFRDWKGMSESELDAHLESKNAISGDKPFETLKYITPDAPKKLKKDLLRDDTKTADAADEDDKLDDDLEADDDKFVEDFEIQFARDLVSQAKGWHRREVLASSKPFFQKREQEQQAHVVDALKKIGVDWTSINSGATPAGDASGKPAGEPNLVASISTDKPKNEVKAGEVIKLTTKVTNKGTGPAGQLRAMLKGDDGLFEGREFVFGRVNPGETRSFTVSVKVPQDALDRTDPLSLDFTEELGRKTKIDSDGITLKVDGPPRPVFSYAYQLVDDQGSSNGDGLAQKGESCRLHVTVRNIGQGKAPDAIAQLRNLSGDGLFFNKGRFPLGLIEPGQTKTMDFTFDVKPELEGNQFRVELSVYDEVLHEYVQDKLSFPTYPAVATSTRTGVVELTADSNVETGASREASVIGTVKKDTLLKATANAGEFVRVELDGRPGYVLKTAVKDATGTPNPAAFAQAWQVSPPTLTLKEVAGLTESDKIHIGGRAKDGTKVSDVYVFVSNRRAKIDRRKVFYRSNRGGKDSKDMSFDTEIPLWPGANVVTVVARQSTSVQSQDTLIVQRGGTHDVAHAKPIAANPNSPAGNPTQTVPELRKPPTK